jgi:predicted transcriptional regulator
LTVVRAFRLDEDVDDALKKISEEEGESVNVMVNRTLRKFVEWDSLAVKFGMVQITRQELVKMLDSLTLEQAREEGVWVGADVFEPLVRYLQPTEDFASVIGSLELLSRYTGRFDLTHSVAGSKHLVVIHHSMGANWSAFYEGAGSTVLRDLLKLDCKSSTTDELCSFEFELDDRKVGG